MSGLSYKEAERRIKAYCRPQLDWLRRTADNKDHRDLARIVGYEDGVRDAIKALHLAAPSGSTPRRPTVNSLADAMVVSRGGVLRWNFTIVRSAGRDAFGEPTGWICRPCALGLIDDFDPQREGGSADER